MKWSTIIGLLFGLSTASLAISTADNKHSSEAATACAVGVHMIVARGSQEAPGEGMIGAIATKVQQYIPGSDSEAVDYPATISNYSRSEASGVAAMHNMIHSYVERCPSSKIALLGYSQVRRLCSI